MSSSPKIARKWMSEEDQRLRNILATIEPGSDINWHHVASNIPGRNNKECRKRWIYSLMPTLKKGPWNDREDALLLEGVRSHGPKWPLVSQSVGTRQPDQCSRRWHESLNPSINHGRWSLFEDQILREAVQQYGRRWTEIVERYFPHRTPIAAKKRYAQCYQQKIKYQSKSDLEPENSIKQSGTEPSTPNSSLKREDSDNSTHLLLGIPDHSQSLTERQSSSATIEMSGPRYIPELTTSSSAPLVPLMCQFSHSIDLTNIPYTAAPDTQTQQQQHYSPTYSRGDSLGRASIAEYPTTIRTDAHIWMPTESQSAYSGSPFLFHDTGYFDPTYTGHFVPESPAPVTSTSMMMTSRP